jgi:hypothetical protein
VNSHNASNSRENRNLTIIFAAEQHDVLEQLAKQDKRSKGQMAAILIEEALQHRQTSASKVAHFGAASHG